MTVRVLLTGTIAVMLAAPGAAAQGTSTAAQTDEAKIAQAMSAAPEEIGRNATIMDWPAKEGEQPRQLRAGTNGWVCFPSTPGAMEQASGEDPMCLDKQWQEWAAAWSGKRAPKITAVGLAYMLKGDRGASNTDPYAKKATPDNEWVHTGPHVMVLLPDPKQLEAVPSDPAGGGPYLMWRGTPYAHIMVPIAGHK